MGRKEEGRRKKQSKQLACAACFVTELETACQAEYSMAIQINQKLHAPSAHC